MLLIVIMGGLDGDRGEKGTVVPPTAIAVAETARERVVEDMIMLGPPGIRVCRLVV